MAAGGLTALLADVGEPLDTAQALAVLALVGLVVFWALPGRANPG